MSGDTTKAVAVCCDYLAFRPGIRTRLLAQMDDGMKAQDLEGTRITAISYDRDEDGEKGPRITDTTGETAIRPDRARLLLGELDRAERSLILEANIVAGHPIVTMADLLCFLNPIARTAPGRVRQSARVFDRAIAETYGRHKPDAGKSADGEAGCQSCARLKVNGTPWWSPVSYNRGRPTDLGGCSRPRYCCASRAGTSSAVTLTPPASLCRRRWSCGRSTIRASGPRTPKYTGTRQHERDGRPTPTSNGRQRE